MAINPKGIAIVITKKKPSKKSMMADEEEAREMDDEMDEAADEEEGGELEISSDFKAASDEMYNAIRAEDRDAFARSLKAAIVTCIHEEEY